MSYIPYILAALVLVVAFLCVVVFRIYRFFSMLGKEISNQNLVEVLQDIVRKENKNAKDLSSVIQDIRALQNGARGHLSRVGLVRYNPFGDMGGDQSFCLALVNDMLDGVIVTSLHSRDRTRVFVKPIVKGVCEMTLSSEEKKSLAIATK
jgi:Protein of unknown function (DUF4446)